MNPRKDKVCYVLWITKQEEKILLDSLGKIPSIAWTLINNANERGDFEKK